MGITMKRGTVVAAAMACATIFGGWSPSAVRAQVLAPSGAYNPGWKYTVHKQTIEVHKDGSTVRHLDLAYAVLAESALQSHHSSDDEAIDRNYVAHDAFLDICPGTGVQSERRSSEKYGVAGLTEKLPC